MRCKKCGKFMVGYPVKLVFGMITIDAPKHQGYFCGDDGTIKIVKLEDNE